MSEIKTLIEVAGGQRKAARMLEVPTSTVHSWLRTGRVPAWRAEKIVEKLREMALAPDAAA